MIIELVATCFLAVGVVYTPPPDWVIDRVGIQGTRNVCMQPGPFQSCLSILVNPIERSFVTLRRPVTVGQKIEAPPGCDMQVHTR